MGESCLLRCAQGVTPRRESPGADWSGPLIGRRGGLGSGDSNVTSAALAPAVGAGLPLEAAPTPCSDVLFQDVCGQGVVRWGRVETYCWYFWLYASTPSTRVRPRRPGGSPVGFSKRRLGSLSLVSGATCAAGERWNAFRGSNSEPCLGRRGGGWMCCPSYPMHSRGRWFFRASVDALPSEPK